MPAFAIWALVHLAVDFLVVSLGHSAGDGMRTLGVWVLHFSARFANIAHGYLSLLRGLEDSFTSP